MHFNPRTSIKFDFDIMLNDQHSKRFKFVRFHFKMNIRSLTTVYLLFLKTVFCLQKQEKHKKKIFGFGLFFLKNIKKYKKKIVNLKNKESF